MEFHQAERQDRRGRRLVSVVVLVGATILVSSWAGLFGFLGANAAVGTIEGLKSEYIPEVDLLELHLPSVSQLSEVYTEDGIRLGFLTERNSQPVPLSDIPDTVINAVLAAEDSGFFDHEGIDFRAIARAGVEQTRGGSIQGGSTITQQVVKQNFGTTERTIERKIREAVVAAELERRYTKEQILEYYVNSVFFGANAYGVKAASQEYFGKELSDITVAEAAAIVTAIRNPTLYDMRDEPERVKRARDDVIANMVNEGFITAAEGERAQAEPLAPIAHKDFQELAPQVIIEVREQLLNDPRFNTGNTFTERKQALFGCAAQDKACEASTSLKGGLTVVTTLDFALQEEANRILRDWFPAAEGGTTPTGAIAMVDNSNGAVRVMASGLDFGDDIEAGQRPYDIAGKGRRNPGSAFKPIGLAAALDNGQRFGVPITLATQWSSASPQILDYPGAPKPWECNNAGGGGGGLRSLEDATIFSVNTVFCQVSIATGAENIVKMAHRLGIESDIEAVPSVVLGSQAVTPLEMASAYSTFANFGARVPSYLVERIEDADGNVIYQHEVEREQVIDRALAASIVRTLQQAVERGTGTRAQIDRPQAGKTGTHQNSTDVWFMGFIPQLTTAVWVGYPDSQIPIRNITIRGNYYSPAYGGTLAAPIWKEFMEIATDGLPVVDFPEDPEGMEPYYAVPKTVVPSISGLGVSGARAAIRQAGLRASTVTVYGDAAKGTLLSMSPGPGTRLNQGATVTLRVAGGPPPSTAMPSFLGLTQDGVLASIAQVLSDSGVVIYPTFTTREVTDPSQIGIVVAQAPGPGTVLPYQVWPTFVMGVAPGG